MFFFSRKGLIKTQSYVIFGSNLCKMILKSTIYQIPFQQIISGWVWNTNVQRLPWSASLAPIPTVSHTYLDD